MHSPCWSLNSLSLLLGSSKFTSHCFLRSQLFNKADFFYLLESLSDGYHMSRAYRSFWLNACWCKSFSPNSHFLLPIFVYSPLPSPLCLCFIWILFSQLYFSSAFLHPGLPTSYDFFVALPQHVKLIQVLIPVQLIILPVQQKLNCDILALRVHKKQDTCILFPFPCI